MNEMNTVNQDFIQIFELFFDDEPIEIERKNTSHGESDFREVILYKCNSGKKYAIKLADNRFTFADKIEMWRRCAEEYRNYGYYCPSIIRSKSDNFPTVSYKGHNCIVYAEEYSVYRSAEDFDKSGLQYKGYFDDALIMTAKVASSQFNFTDYPSGNCLFDCFCPDDSYDEVMENALEWKRYADTLPSEFREQTQRIWKRWIDNRDLLETLYGRLPTSVFQADLNPSNILLDDHGKFVGVYDFNLCGKDVFLNYLFREIYRGNYEEELKSILSALKTVSRIYKFSDIEKTAAPLLYRCIKPLWFTRVQDLKEAGDKNETIKKHLDETEIAQTRTIDFSFYMSANTDYSSL